MKGISWLFLVLFKIFPHSLMSEGFGCLVIGLFIVEVNVKCTYQLKKLAILGIYPWAMI